MATTPPGDGGTPADAADDAPESASSEVDAPVADLPDAHGSDAPVTDRTDVPRPVPSQEELDRIAVDVRIRRRPRYGVFVGTTMLLAGIVAYVVAARVPQDVHSNWGATVWVTTLGATAFGALLGAGIAVFADWLSRRK